MYNLFIISYQTQTREKITIEGIKFKNHKLHKLSCIIISNKTKTQINKKQWLVKRFQFSSLCLLLSQFGRTSCYRVANAKEDVLLSNLISKPRSMKLLSHHWSGICKNQLFNVKSVNLSD